MDSDKFNYFLAKYRAADVDVLEEAQQRRNLLAEEAEAALAQVTIERNLSFVKDAPSEPEPKLEPDKVALTPEQLVVQTKLSSELWNGSLAKTCRMQFSFLFMVPVFNLLGAQGFRLGALPLLLIVVPASYLGLRLGKSCTRRICARADVSLADKKTNLRILFWIMWPAIIVATLAVTAIFGPSRVA